MDKMRYVGFGTRVLNFLIDTLVIFLLSLAANKGWQWYVTYYGYPFLNYWFIYFSITVVYYLIFESLFGKSPAKWATYCHVVGKDGKKPSFLKILLRSLLRVIILDSFFIPFFDKTLHDYLSGTEVVRD